MECDIEGRVANKEASASILPIQWTIFQVFPLELVIYSISSPHLTLVLKKHC